MLNLDILENSPHFRADNLYFIHQTTNYMRSIFWDVFRSGTSHRKKMYDFARKHFDASQQNSPLFYGITRKSMQRADNIDPLDQQFINFIQNLPPDLRAPLQARLEQEHALPYNLQDICNHLDNLRHKRNYLTHYDTQKNKPKQFCEQLAQSFMATMLHPELYHQWIGRVQSHGMKQPLPQRQTIHNTVLALHAIAKEATEKRRTTTRQLYSEQRSKKHGKLNKKERKDKVTSIEKWRESYLKYYPAHARDTAPKMHYFKTCYHFIGKENIMRLHATILNAPPLPFERHMDTPPTRDIHFKRDIECLFLLGARINMLLFRHLPLDIAKRIDAIKDAHQKVHLRPLTQRIDKIIRQQKTCRNTPKHAELEAERQQLEAEKTRLKNITPPEILPLQQLQRIRDVIAHNGSFWHMHDHEGQEISLYTIFFRVFAFLKDENLDAVHDAYTGLYTLFTKEKYDRLYPKDGSCALSIHRWTLANRTTYLGNPAYTLEKRHNVKRIVAQCLHDLRQAKEDALKKTRDFR